MRSFPLLAGFTFLSAKLALSLSAIPVQAAWPREAALVVDVCRDTTNQINVSTCSDGSGGLFVAWEDYREASNGPAIYMQHLTDEGLVAPGWPLNGRAIGTTPAGQTQPRMASDGAGGAIVVWEDWRGSAADIYALRVLSSGDPASGWAPDGVLVCGAAQDQMNCRIVEDGQNGAFVVWEDGRFRTGPGNMTDVYGTRVTADGVIAGGWPDDGLAICNRTGTQSAISALGDGSGGLFVTWLDSHDRTYLAHYSDDGMLATGWIVNGNDVGVYNSNGPRMALDGAGAVLLVWDNGNDVFAQRVLVDGSIAPFWPPDGKIICDAAYFQLTPRLVSDGEGGGIVVWIDSRADGSLAGYDIYAQRFDSQANTLWMDNGVPISTAAGPQVGPEILTDGAGGALVAWMDLSLAQPFGQHLYRSGATDDPINGYPLSTVAGVPVLAPSGNSAVAVWIGAGDVFAQRFNAFGRLGRPDPVLLSVTDVPLDQGGKVRLTFSASDLDVGPAFTIDSYEVWRETPAQEAARALRGTARLLGTKGAPLRARPGDLRITTESEQVIYWEFLASLPARGFTNYSYVAATTSDSVAAGNPLTRFQVVALEGSSMAQWASVSLSGYSVDNMSPVEPTGFAGELVPGHAPSSRLSPLSSGSIRLHWNKNPETDLAVYHLYRGDGPDFLPGPETFVAALSVTSFNDTEPGSAYYKLTAVDVHGNEGPWSSLNRPQISGIGDEQPPFVLRLGSAYPNPLRSTTRITFGIAVPGAASLGLFDLGGRKIRQLLAGPVEPGDHGVTWDGRDDSGSSVAAGVYFYQLEAAGRRLSGRVSVAR